MESAWSWVGTHDELHLVATEDGPHRQALCGMFGTADPAGLEAITKVPHCARCEDLSSKGGQ